MPAIASMESAVKAEFFRAAKLGITLSANQLATFCKKRGYKVDMKYLRSLRHQFKFTALFSKYSHSLRYFGTSFLRPGLVQVIYITALFFGRLKNSVLFFQFDMANYHPEFQKENHGMRAFLVGCDMLSGFLAAEPCPDLTTESWKHAVIAMAEGRFNEIRVAISDRDSAVKSGKEGAFRDFLLKKFNIKWRFNPFRVKAYLSEKYIGKKYIKECHRSQSFIILFFLPQVSANSRFLQPWLARKLTTGRSFCRISANNTMLFLCPDQTCREIQSRAEILLSCFLSWKVPKRQHSLSTSPA